VKQQIRLIPAEKAQIKQQLDQNISQREQTQMFYQQAVSKLQATEDDVLKTNEVLETLFKAQEELQLKIDQKTKEYNRFKKEQQEQEDQLAKLKKQNVELPEVKKSLSGVQKQAADQIKKLKEIQQNIELQRQTHTTLNAIRADYEEQAQKTTV